MTVTYLIPVFANFFGVVFLDEVVTHWMMGCAVVIVAGTALASGLVGRKLSLQAKRLPVTLVDRFSRLLARTSTLPCQPLSKGAFK
jgi:hypothetical protein